MRDRRRRVRKRDHRPVLHVGEGAQELVGDELAGPRAVGPRKAVEDITPPHVNRRRARRARTAFTADPGDGLVHPRQRLGQWRGKLDERRDRPHLGFDLGRALALKARDRKGGVAVEPVAPFQRADKVRAVEMRGLGMQIAAPAQRRLAVHHVDMAVHESGGEERGRVVQFGPRAAWLGQPLEPRAGPKGVRQPHQADDPGDPRAHPVLPEADDGRIVGHCCRPVRACALA